ncbi:hypothetical protein [Methylobacterium dankookense]|uniref:Large exoprotein involved in heme utilization or adhesion n=1 Tax=Methylobacterium dankookense TaxID=560405 RepID=A0A564FRI4_9HYPH|nr:hypothetical protein [Methylobacterium dankookense]GJD58932.1 hypothetical protein IFDJLNFL_4858 [Methylobacterium dankookense]VUF10557.1 hypothetical protein MTDSW087_00224 [Methylobacterium dankookense]
MKALTLFAALPLIAVSLGGAEAASRKAQVPNRFDGNWSIEVITESGSCDRAYRYGVRIEQGQASYPGGDFQISGRVTPNGAVRATISNSLGSANVVGRLAAGGYGNGTWTASGSNQCRGRWNAERRG